jgi:HNH endonuclease
MSLDKFWSKVNKTKTCWLWTAMKNVFGYGELWTGKKPNRKRKLAHRISWELRFGKIPEGLGVLHKCDVRNCVNPEHLFLGTFLDNMKDKLSKGRQAKHERSGMARLTEKNVSEIRSLYSSGLKQHEIAKQFKINQGQISRIVRFEAWK